MDDGPNVGAGVGVGGGVAVGDTQFGGEPLQPDGHGVAVGAGVGVRAGVGVGVGTGVGVGVCTGVGVAVGLGVGVVHGTIAGCIPPPPAVIGQITASGLMREDLKSARLSSAAYRRSTGRTTRGTYNGIPQATRAMRSRLETRNTGLLCIFTSGGADGGVACIKAQRSPDPVTNAPISVDWIDAMKLLNARDISARTGTARR